MVVTNQQFLPTYSGADQRVTATGTSVAILGFFCSGTRPAKPPNPSTGTYLRISICRWYNTVARASHAALLRGLGAVRRIGKRPRFPVGKQYVVFRGVLSRHKLGISFLKILPMVRHHLFINVVIGAGGTIIIVTMGGLVIGRGIENVGSRVILSLSSSAAAAAGSNRLEWTAMKIQRDMVGAFLTFKNPLVLCVHVNRLLFHFVHSVLLSNNSKFGSTANSGPAASCSPFILFYSFLGEDGRQSSISKTGGSTETDLMIVAKKEKRKDRIEQEPTKDGAVEVFPSPAEVVVWLTLLHLTVCHRRMVGSHNNCRESNRRPLCPCFFAVGSIYHMYTPMRKSANFVYIYTFQKLRAGEVRPMVGERKMGNFKLTHAFDVLGWV
jgi:hypothetical protein